VSTAAVGQQVDDLALVGAGLSMMAGTVHAGLAPHHFEHAWWLGAGFVLAAAAQTAWAILALRGELLARAAVLGNLLLVGVWLLSRTAGLPGVGAEPVGVVDVLTVSLELSLCGLLAGLPRAQAAGLIFAATLVCVWASGMALH